MAADMVAYKLRVHGIGAERTAAIMDFVSARDDLAIARAARFAGVFPHDVWNGARLVHRIR
jgi:hypothetical protein